jgi:TP901 family phage tail tape measure protein
MKGGALDLGDLYTKLRVDFSDFAKAEKAGRKFSKEAISGFDKTEAAGRKLKKTGKVVSGFAAILLGMGGASAKMSNDFDKGISEINSLLPAATRDFKGLKESVRSVSLALGTDLADGAGAAYQAISAGVPKDNIVSFLTVATKAAIAGVTDTEVAVDGITTVMNAWKAEAGSATDVADVMFTAVKNGKTTFQELSSSMFQVAGIAPELGVDFKEIAASAAQMTSQGIPTSVAMTQMRASMVALAKPNAEMVKLLETSGIESVKASIAQIGLVGTLTKLQKAATKSNISIDKAMGGAEAMGLVYKTTGDNASGFAKNMDGMTKSADAANSAFEEVDKTRGFDKLINQGKILATIIGDALTPVLIPMAEHFGEFIKKVAMLDPKLIQIGVVVLGVIAAMGPLLIMVGSIVTLMAPAVGAVGGLSAAFATLAALAGPVGIAILAIVAVMTVLYKNWDIVSAFIRVGVHAIIKWFNQWKENNAGLISSISESWNKLLETGRKLWTSLQGLIERFVRASVIVLNDILEPIGGLKGAWVIMQKVMSAALTLLGGQLKVFFDFVSEIFSLIADVLDGNISVWDALKSAIFVMIKAMISTLGNLHTFFRSVFGKIWDYLKSLNWKQMGIDMMQGLANGLQSVAMLPVTAAKAMAGRVKSAVTDFFAIQSPSKVFAEIGRFTMIGFAIGITAAAPQAIAAAEIAASETLAKFEETIQARNGNFAMGENTTIAGFPDLAEISAYYDARLDLLNTKGLAETQLFKSLELDKYNSVKAGQRAQLNFYGQSFDAMLDAAKDYAGEQSGIYKGLFAVSKGFAIAEAAIAMQQNIANASKVGFPYNIPMIAGAITQGLGIAASIQSVGTPAKAYRNGGVVSSGRSGIAGESGVEIVGPTGVISAAQTKGMLGGGSTNVYVEIVDNSGGSNTHRVEQSSTSEGERLKIFIEAAEDKISTDISRGTGKIQDSIESAWSLGRRGN